MFLPPRYALRNLARDPARLAQTLLGSALVVLLVMGAHALNHGMRQTLSTTGSPHNIILLGTGSEESMQRSQVSEQAAGIAEASLADLHAPLGQRAISAEIVHMALLGVPEGGHGRGLVRGVTPNALLAHPRVTLLEGTFPRPNQLLAGRLAWKRFGLDPDDLRPGAQLEFDGVPLTVSGTFAAPGSVLDSEIWMPLNDLRTLAQRDTISAVTLRLAPGADPTDVELFTRQRLDLELTAIPEAAYYDRLADFYAPIRAMTWTTAVLIAAAALFGGLNTLYAAFASRVREIGTLQAIGFRRGAILLSFIQESLITTGLGTLLGALTASVLFQDRLIALGPGAFQLALGPETLFTGLAAGLGLGLLGALPPAIRCLTPPLPQALRD